MQNQMLGTWKFLPALTMMNSDLDIYHCSWQNYQRDAQIPFYVFIFIYNSLHVLSASCSSSGETNCINATSGNCHSMLVACTRHGHQHR
jgi:hypothetical protein